VPEKLDEDEAQVSHAEQLMQKLLEQRRRGEVAGFKMSPFRDRTPAELRELRREGNERGWI
jgi:hypothetical protein